MADTDSCRLINDGVPLLDWSEFRFFGLFSAPTPGDLVCGEVWGDFSGADLGAVTWASIDIAFWCIGVVTGSGAHENDLTCSSGFWNNFSEVENYRPKGLFRLRLTFLCKWLLDCEFLLVNVVFCCLFGWIEPNLVTLWLKELSSSKSSCELEELPADEISCLPFNERCFIWTQKMESYSQSIQKSE